MNEMNGSAIHIVGVEAKMVGRLTFAHVELEPGGRLVKVTGKNRAGKTALLRLIREVLGGAGEVLPLAVNEESEDGKGAGTVSLSNGYTITRAFTSANPKGYLKVVGPFGGEHKQGRIDDWLGDNHDFDFLSFFGLKPERQSEILLGLSPDPDLAPKLRHEREQYQTLYAERTPYISEQQRYRRVKAPRGERPEPIDTSAETLRLSELQAKDQFRKDLNLRVRDAERDITAIRHSRIAASEDIDRLKLQLKKAEARFADASVQLAERDAEREELAEKLNRTPSVMPEIEATMARLAEADDVNKALEPWREYERAQEGLAGATVEAERLTVAMKAARERERKLVATAGIPVEGLTFDPETAEPLLNGRPFEVASGAERIRMAMDVAVAKDPDLKVVLIDEANDLDLDMLREVADEAKARNIQVWCCRIGLEGDGDVMVADGVARSAEPVTP